ncbi:hypothetical protein MTR_2g021090 [Medicago truncatula]|uniref:Uncharacterized protein n=1 Tax=Medicago truncatula TaxID=3880 RepID=G7IKC4_MEDTR|nr:hypothetical protein MTR_2g021090 [Medicago truncatula]
MKKESSILQVPHRIAYESLVSFVAAIRWIWRWRNNIVLGDKIWKLSTTDSCAPNNRSKVKWKAHPSGKFKLNVDGSCDQSGVIGSGGLIPDALKSQVCWIISVFKHVLCEGNVCADFLARLERNSTLGVTTWVTHPEELLLLLNFDAFDF